MADHELTSMADLPDLVDGRSELHNRCASREPRKYPALDSFVALFSYVGRHQQTVFAQGPEASSLLGASRGVVARMRLVGIAKLFVRRDFATS